MLLVAKRERSSWSALKTFYTDLFLKKRLFTGLVASSIIFILSFFLDWLGIFPYIFFFCLLILTIIDILLLFRIKNGIYAHRESFDKMSNGDENQFLIHLENFYPYWINAEIIDEIPVQFQVRDLYFKLRVNSGEKKNVNYHLRPTKRGEYEFGNVHVFVSSPIGLISRRYTFAASETLPVYPSFLQMKKYQLMAMSNKLVEKGIKKIRRLGHSMEFEHIKNYVTGDDQRTVNWKATARRGDLMVNSFTDEKAQNLYCVIDKSRTMKMPFEGLSLLDYAINASLAISNVALLKGDRAGLITLSEKIGTVLPADRKPMQLSRILHTLYREKSRYLEANMEALYAAIRGSVKQRSLLIFFTNFESLSALERQLPFLKRIARFHNLVIVFFENTELKKLSEETAHDVEGIYIQTIAAKFVHEKERIVKELNRHGIQSILTRPENLTVNTINKYLEIKSRGI